MTDRPDSTVSRRAFLAATASAVAAFIAACATPASPASPAASRSAASAATLPPASSPSAASSSGGLPPVASPSRSAPPPGPTLEEKIAGLMIVGFRGATLRDADWVRVALVNGELGGVILFDRDQLTRGERNVVSPAQVRRLTGDLRAAAGSRPILIGVDQEGGVVTRLGPAHGYPPVASEATVGHGTTGAATRWATELAGTVSDAGFNLNFAPVVDLDVNPRSPAIGALDRSFSANADVVVARATTEIDAHRAAGILTTLKHFPGIGSSSTNTDFGVADVTETWTRAELAPFRRLIDAGEADLVMAGHVVNGQIDRDHPASLSRETVTDLLRGELGWSGVVVTDDLQAAAITEAFGDDEAVLLALEAGNDLLLFANQQVYDPRIVSRVVGVVGDAVASGRIAASRIDDSWKRVQTAIASVR